MEQMDILRKLFDEKLLVVINALLDNPERNFSLTEISLLSRINISTTLRILDKLIKQDVVELVLIGKSKFYKLKQSEKILFLNKLLKKEEHIFEFIERIKKDLRVKKIILESKTENGAKLLIVGDLLPKEKITSLIEDIKSKHGYRIQYLEISQKQYEDMREIGIYNLDKKIIWERK